MSLPFITFKVHPTKTLKVIKGKFMVRCKFFKEKLKLHIISKVVICKTSLTLNYLKNHILIIWASKINKFIKTMNMIFFISVSLCNVHQ